MESWVTVTLVLGVITMANCASLRESPWSSEDAIIAKAMDSYNRVPGVTAVFKLLEAAPGNRPEDSASPGQLRFTIKETVCPKLLAKEDTEECAFKDPGLVKDCTASTVTELGSSTLVVTCDTMIPKTHIRRSRQVRQCVIENNQRKCKGNGKPPRPGFGSSVARPAKDQARFRRSRDATEPVKKKEGREDKRKRPRPSYLVPLSAQNMFSKRALETYLPLD